MNWFTMLTVITSLSAVALPAVEIIAHRGASFDAPENTLAALKLGFEQNADAGELDIRMTSDGRIVLLHDENTARISTVSNRIAESTWAEVSKIEAGSWGKWKGKGFHETIPTLADALKLVPAGKRMFVEIKCGDEVLPELERVFNQSGLKPEQTVIIGFGYDTMKAAKARFPNRKVFWLVGADKKKRYPAIDKLITEAREAGVDGLNLEQGFPIDAAFVRKVHDAGLQLYTWTVDDPAVARRLAAAGVDGITTNRPQWLRGQIAL